MGRWGTRSSVKLWVNERVLLLPIIRHKLHYTFKGKLCQQLFSAKNYLNYIYYKIIKKLFSFEESLEGKAQFLMLFINKICEQILNNY